MDPTSTSVESPSRRAAEATAAAAGGDLVVHPDPLFVRTAVPSPTRRVALVSGGGAGHEPLHIGFLGAGGLDAVCPGEVFTSPHSQQIYQAGRAVAGPGGVLQIVKNYTGDVINFRIAAERLRTDGVPVATVLVADDVASAGAATGMRGTAATVIIEKVLGAAADSGASLTDLAELGEQLVTGSRSIAVAYDAHHDRETGALAFGIEEGRLEFGVGIHGERASGQIDTESSQALTERMTRRLLAELDPDGPLLVLVNGLGGLSNFDLAIVAGDVGRVLAGEGVQVESLVVGTFVSALDMRGFSVTFCAADEGWLPWWYAEHTTPALPRPRPFRPAAAAAPRSESRTRTDSAWATSLVRRLGALRTDFNALDAAAGDGDFGDNLARGLDAALAAHLDPPDDQLDDAGPGADLGADLGALGSAFLDDVGGSSGPLLGVLLQATAAAVTAATAATAVTAVTVFDGGSEAPSDPAQRLAAAAASGLADGARAVSRIGGAQPGERTMIDALAGLLCADITVIDHAAADRVLRDAEATAAMRARRGRASYLADRVGAVPDAGALAVAALVIAVSERLDRSDHADLWSRLTATVRQQAAAD